MKLTEEIRITKHYEGQSPRDQPAPSITDKPIEELIEQLREYGIEIDPECSEKEIKYSLRTDASSDKTIERTVAVPLPTRFTKGAKPVYFLLRDGSGLELELRNYRDVPADSDERQLMSQIMGYFKGELGIVCSVSVIGEKVNSSVVDTIKKALKKTYESSS